MHVLMTADTVGGVWTYVRELVTGLARRGVKVTLVSFGGIPSAEQTAWLDAVPAVDYRPTGFKLEWMQDCDADLFDSQEYLRAIVDEVRPDVLHSNQFVFGASDFGIPKIVVAHSDVVTWWRAVHDREPKVSEVSPEYRYGVARGLAGADHIIAPSKAMLAALRGAYGPLPEGRVVYNGRSPELFSPHITKELNALTVGRIWDGGKQTALLFKAETDYPVAIVGDCEHPEESLRSAFGITSPRPGIVFKGSVGERQLAQMYARAATYIACSRYEPFGLAPLEAALSRCVLVANDIPSFREIWGDAALYFTRNDARSLGEVLEAVRNDAGLRIEYGNRALLHAKQNYSSRRMTDEYLACYQTMLRSGALAA